jgi:di/tricarboxylate transporter
MTFEIALVLIILMVAIVLFLQEKLRVDLIALLVLGSLAISGLVTPLEAFSGFSNPAVITVWAMFIISAGLSHTGVAKIIGQQVLRMAGEGEARLIAVIMLSAGVMSAFMNNIGVAALLLPVVMDLGRRTGHPPSRLLMPLAYGCLLGGLTTLIGTPPNILASDALREFGLTPFRIFDFTPIGILILVICVAFMVFVGRHMLPVRDPQTEFTATKPGDMLDIYSLGERLFTVKLPSGSEMAGKTLAESHFGATLGFNVIGIIRNGKTILSPDPEIRLQPDDRLLSIGKADRLAKLSQLGELQVESTGLGLDQLVSSEIDLAKIGLSPGSEHLGKSLRGIDFRRKYGLNVLSIWRDGIQKQTNLQDMRLKSGDVLLVQGPRQNIEQLQETEEFLVSSVETAEISQLNERLMAVRIPDDSPLEGKTLSDSHLGAALGLTVLGISREGEKQLAPSPIERLKVGDILLVEGREDVFQAMIGLQNLEIEPERISSISDLESDKVGLAEVVLSPHSTLFGQTLRQIRFREKYGLSVLAIWREGRSYRTNLGNFPLRLGDALLIYGRRDKAQLLGREPDFLVLYEEAQEIPAFERAPLAVAIMGVILLPVLLGWLPISVAAVSGAALMVLTRCLSMEQAYHAIEWKAVFLIAGMLPLGIAMEQTGAALMIANGIVSMVGELGPFAILATLFLLTSITTQVMPSPAVVVLLAPIVLNTAQDMKLSPYALMMGIAIAASASFLSPVAHPANVLVLGPGGYRFADYFRLGIPLTIVVLILVMLVLPIFFPLTL